MLINFLVGGSGSGGPKSFAKFLPSLPAMTKTEYSHKQHNTNKTIENFSNGSCKQVWMTSIVLPNYANLRLLLFSIIADYLILRIRINRLLDRFILHKFRIKFFPTKIRNTSLDLLMLITRRNNSRIRIFNAHNSSYPALTSSPTQNKGTLVNATALPLGGWAMNYAIKL